MPYQLINHKGKYSVENKNTKHLFSKGTTFSKAKAQMRLLYGVEHGLKLKKKNNGMP